MCAVAAWFYIGYDSMVLGQHSCISCATPQCMLWQHVSTSYSSTVFLWQHRDRVCCLVLSFCLLLAASYFGFHSSMCILHVYIEQIGHVCDTPPCVKKSMALYALQRKPHLCIFRKEIARPQSQFPPTFMCLWAIYIFPGSVQIFSCSIIGRPIVGI
jgi:hypothetical protein